MLNMRARASYIERRQIHVPCRGLRTRPSPSQVDVYEAGIPFAGLDRLPSEGFLQQNRDPAAVCSGCRHQNRDESSSSQETNRNALFSRGYQPEENVLSVHGECRPQLFGY